MLLKSIIKVSDPILTETNKPKIFTKQNSEIVINMMLAVFLLVLITYFVNSMTSMKNKDHKTEVYSLEKDQKFIAENPDFKKITFEEFLMKMKSEEFLSLCVKERIEISNRPVEEIKNELDKKYDNISSDLTKLDQVIVSFGNAIRKYEGAKQRLEKTQY